MATTTKQQAPFAVIMTGGKQYIVSVGDVLEVEMLGDFSAGDAIEFDTVLMTDDGSSSKIGAPYTGTKVKATYMGMQKGEKITILRYKAKSNRDRKIGHRQKYSAIKIESIA